MLPGKRYKDLVIKRLEVNQSENLSNLLIKADREYTKYFIPFNYDKKSIQSILRNAKNDRFYGLFVQEVLVGFYMLRGFDEGYAIPSYGVWITREYSGIGLSTLTLQHAISFCKLNNIKTLMLKVHPENLAAKHIYEKYGFVNKGIDPKNDNLIYYKEL